MAYAMNIGVIVGYLTLVLPPYCVPSPPRRVFFLTFADTVGISAAFLTCFSTTLP